MKRLILLVSCILLTFGASAQVKFVDAKELTLVNKLCPTEKLYDRVDTDKYDFNEAEATRLRFTGGLALAFETNSTTIDIKTQYSDYRSTNNSTLIATAGYDLYIMDAGEWKYAYSGVAAKNYVLHLIKDMDTTCKQCLLYLPTYSRVDSIWIGVDEKASIKAMANPFRHRIMIIGSSYTHGTGVSRSGMAYPLQLERATGLQFVALGVSGQSKMQPAFAQLVCDNQCDALVMDAFSNPDAATIRARVIPFIAKIREVHPKLPIIFLRSIYREGRNFNRDIDDFEAAKDSAAVEMMSLAMKQFDDVYFLDVTSQTGTDHITSVDGVHPDDLGYWRWANAIRPVLVSILKKYGIE